MTAPNPDHLGALNAALLEAAADGDWAAVRELKAMLDDPAELARVAGETSEDDADA